MTLQQYIEIRSNLSCEKVSLGYRAVTLFPAGELDDAQVGYSISPSGESLTGENGGDWRSSWLVVGYEDLLGDPILVDLSAQQLPVYKALHGEGTWNPVLIASSFSGFIQALEKIDLISQGRRNLVQLQQNPLSVVERKRVLREIAESDENALLDFWESWFDV